MKVSKLPPKSLRPHVPSLFSAGSCLGSSAEIISTDSFEPLKKSWFIKINEGYLVKTQYHEKIYQHPLITFEWCLDKYKINLRNASNFLIAHLMQQIAFETRVFTGTLKIDISQSVLRSIAEDFITDMKMLGL